MESSRCLLLSSPIQFTESRTRGMAHRVSLKTTNKEKLIDLTTRLVLERAVNHKEFTTTGNGVHVSVFELEERSVVFDLVKELDDDISWSYELIQTASEDSNKDYHDRTKNNNHDKAKNDNHDKTKDDHGKLSRQQASPPDTSEQEKAKTPSLEKNGMYQFPSKPTFKPLPNTPPTSNNRPTATLRTADSVVRSASPPRHSTDHDGTRKSNDERSTTNTTPKTTDSVVPSSSPTGQSRRESRSATTTPRTIDSIIRPPSSHSTDLSNRVDTLIRPSSPPRHSKGLSSRLSRRQLVPDETQHSIMEEHIYSRRNGHGKRKSVHLNDQDYDRIKIPKEETTSKPTTTDEPQPIPVERKEITTIPVSRIQSKQNIVIKHPEQEPINIGQDWMFYYKILLIRNEPHSQTSGPIHLHIHGYMFRVLFELVSLKCKVTVFYEGCSNVVVSVMKTVITAISALPGQESQCVPSKDPETHATISPETPRHEQIGSFEFPMVWKLRERRLFYILMKIS